MIFGQFYPSAFAKSTYEIDFEGYYEKGMRGIIFDVDNTLVMHDAPANDAAIALFERLRKIGYKTVLLSNNKEPRVKTFCEAVGGSDYVFKGGKPGKRGYYIAMRKMETNKSNTLFVGDQLFTDIWGANRSGLHSVLVEPIDPHEEIQIILKRIPEKLLFKLWRRS